MHNQGDHIRQIVSTYLAKLATLDRPAEVIIVTNGCTDASPAIARDLAAEHENVRTTDLPEPGWGRSVRVGLGLARGDLLCYTNCARTTAEMLALLLIYEAAYPHVVLKANRKIRDNWRRRLGSLLYNLECRALFDLPIWDINGTPKVFPREFDGLLALTRDDDLIDLEFAWVCKREGYPILEVPLLATQRHGGRSTTNYGSALRMYVGAWRLQRDVEDA